jgi:hypothetical protein
MTTAASRAIAELLDMQRSLAARTRDLAGDASAVLRTGREVLTFAEREEAAFFPLLPLLDPAALAELGDEHQQLADDLDLLESLVTTTPDSPDVAVLADALARRMASHIARDGRLLAQAARMAPR